MAAAAAVTSALPFDVNSTPGNTNGLGSPQTLDGLPTLDGQISADALSRAGAAVDWGRSVRAVPSAVLKPGSVRDVIKVVEYANKRTLRIAMRGQGHSTYGQAQVENGIVIDSSPLNALRWQVATRHYPSGLVQSEYQVAG
jgi:cytokinin dehydrogenase